MSKLCEDKTLITGDPFKDVPHRERWFNCHGDCLIYENNVLIGKWTKSGKYIDFTKEETNNQ